MRTTPPPAEGDAAALAARYGTERRRRPWVAVVLVVVVAALLGVVGWVATQPLERDVTATLVSYGGQTESSIEATVDVLRPEGTAVVCSLSAIDEYFQVAGQRDVVIAADGPARVRVTAVVPTLGRAKVVRLDGCEPAG